MHSQMMNRWFYKLHRQEEEGLASFEEVFGRPPEQAFERPNPFDGPGPGEDEEETPPPDDSAESDDGRDDGVAPGEEDEEDEADELEPWEQEMLARGFEQGAFNETGWRTYRSLETAFSQRQPAEQQPPAPQQEEAPPPQRLLGGSVGEIRTEEQLVESAQASPRATAEWALENRDRLSDEQFAFVMNTWFVSNPYEYNQFQVQAVFQAVEERMGERFAHETAHQVDQARENGLAEAYAEMPLIQDYRPQLSAYMNANPHLNEWVNGLRTAGEVKSAVQSIFYMMAGPELAREALAQRAQTEVARAEAEAATAAAEAAGEAAPPAADGAAAARTTRRSAQPRAVPGAAQLSDADYAKGMQDKILSMPG